MKSVGDRFNARMQIWEENEEEKEEGEDAGHRGKGRPDKGARMDHSTAVPTRTLNWGQSP
jgi:hypothetical protein